MALLGVGGFLVWGGLWPEHVHDLFLHCWDLWNVKG